MACLCAKGIQTNCPAFTPAEGPPPLLTCYTYGQPPVGDAEWALDYNRRVPRTYRVVNDVDIVPTLINLSFYSEHVGHFVLMNNDGIWLNPDPIQAPLSWLPSASSSPRPSDLTPTQP
jgi:hypothetical protein